MSDDELPPGFCDTASLPEVEQAERLSHPSPCIEDKTSTFDVDVESTSANYKTMMGLGMNIGINHTTTNSRAKDTHNTVGCEAIKEEIKNYVNAVRDVRCIVNNKVASSSVSSTISQTIKFGSDPVLLAAYNEDVKMYRETQNALLSQMASGKLSAGQIRAMKEILGDPPKRPSTKITGSTIRNFAKQEVTSEAYMQVMDEIQTEKHHETIAEREVNKTIRETYGVNAMSVPGVKEFVQEQVHNSSDEIMKKINKLSAQAGSSSAVDQKIIFNVPAEISGSTVENSATVKTMTKAILKDATKAASKIAMENMTSVKDILDSEKYVYGSEERNRSVGDAAASQLSAIGDIVSAGLNGGTLTPEHLQAAGGLGIIILLAIGGAAIFLISKFSPMAVMGKMVGGGGGGGIGTGPSCYLVTDNKKMSRYVGFASLAVKIGLIFVVVSSVISIVEEGWETLFGNVLNIFAAVAGLVLWCLIVHGQPNPIFCMSMMLKTKNGCDPE